MESILNQLFWLWAPLSLLPGWLRIFIVLFVILQLARPILFTLAPPIISLLCRLLKKILYLVSYPIMAPISTILRNRREAGTAGLPFWVDWIEGMFALFEKVFDKLIQLSMKRKRQKGRMKKWTFYGATAIAVLLTAAITNNPNEGYSLKWKNAEAWLTQKEKQLSGNRPAVPASTQVTATPPPEKELVLNAPYKNGGNIREAPTLTARHLYTIAVGEAVRFLNEVQVDSKGLKWLKVETVDGRIVGWVSSRIVKEK